MRFTLLLVILLIGLEYKLIESRLNEEIEDNEFAEFEDFEEEDLKNEIKNKGNSESLQTGKKKQEGGDDDDDIVDDDEDMILEVDEAENEEDSIVEVFRDTLFLKFKFELSE